MYYYICGCDVAQFVINSFFGEFSSPGVSPCLFCEPINNPAGWWIPPQHRRNLHEQEVDFNEDLGQMHDSFVDGEDDFWDDAFFDCAHPLEEECHQTFVLPVVCCAALKKSLHIKVSMEGVDILALVDTGATSSFVQQSLV